MTSPTALARAPRPILTLVPRKFKWLAVLALLVAGAIVTSGTVPSCGSGQPKVVTPTSDGEATFLFCTWNVENLFDDKKDKRNAIDTEYDTPFAEDA